MGNEPSLVRFVLDRLDDDLGMVLLNSPVVLDEEAVPDERFRNYIGDRNQLAERIVGTRKIVRGTVDAMAREQGQVAIPATTDAAPVTELGSHILKTVASWYADHPDFNDAWRL